MTAHLHTPDDPRIFVFGSNLMGIHGAGAAKYAFRHLGAEWGISRGPTGRAYALPTCRAPGQPLPRFTISRHIAVFIEYASSYADAHPDVRFFVSAVGCGFAGYAEGEIAPMFAGAPDNCDLPPGWR